MTKPRSKSSSKPRINSLVKFKREYYSPEDEKRYFSDILDQTFIYLGDIVNQPGHCILIRVGPKPGLAGTFELFRHTADFEELSEDEI